LYLNILFHVGNLSKVLPGIFEKCPGQLPGNLGKSWKIRFSGTERSDHPAWGKPLNGKGMGMKKKGAGKIGM
jgi:hypothetical protein